METIYHIPVLRTFLYMFGHSALASSIIRVGNKFNIIPYDIDRRLLRGKIICLFSKD